MGFSRRDLVLVVAPVAVVFVVLDQGRLRWVALAVLIGGALLYVRRVSSSWLKILGQEISSFSGRMFPHDPDEWLRPFVRLGFSKPLWWEIDDRVGVIMLSSAGSVTARSAMVDSDGGPIFWTEWPDAFLLTSRGLGVSIRSNDYLQILPRLGVSDLYAAHNEAIGILSQRYGQPAIRNEWTIEGLNGATRLRYEWLRRHQYLRTAKALARWYANLGYRGRIAQQLSLTTNVWLAGFLLVGTWVFVGWAWVVAFSDPSSSQKFITTVVTLIASVFSAAAFTSFLKRRHFS